MEFTITELVFQKVSELELGDSFSKKEFLISVYGKNQYSFGRSFDVLFVNAKKKLHPKKFRTIKRQITRIE